MPLLSGFIQNAAFLLALALIFDLRGRWPIRARSHAESGIIGAFIGVIAVATMIFPVRVEPGLILDTRGIALALGALAFGLGPALVGAAIATVYRIAVIGGPTVHIGVAFIVATVAIGLAARALLCHAFGRPLRNTPASAFALLGLSIGLIQLGLTGAFLGDLTTPLLARLAGPVLAVHVAATSALGLLLKGRRQRLKTERDLHEREATFRTLTEQLPAIVYRASIDEASSTLYVSPAVSRLGFTPEEWVTDHDLWLRQLHPDDADRVLATLAADRAAGRPSDLTYRLRTASGEYRTFHDAAEVVRTTDGRALYLQGVMTDITDIEKMRETVMLEAAALEAAADAIAITDADGRFLWVNRAFTDLTGYTVEETVGQTPSELLRSGRHDQPFYKDLWDTLMAGHVWTGELINRRKDGTEYHEEQTVTPVKDAAGRITNFIAIKRDISERLNLEQQYRQAQKMEGIGRLAGGIAHDLNNLLTVINGTVELALPGADQTPGLRSDLLEIRRATDRAASLTRQLLAFSRQQVLRVEVLDLNRIVRELVKMLSRLIGEDVRIETQLAADLGHIRGDAGQLEQVLMNLTINARDAMPDGGTLTVETSNVELDDAFAARHVTVKPGPHVCVVVRDTGVGMDEATRARVFEPFFTTKESGKGTGLGLSTVYGIVKQSGGSIWVDSAPRKGTTFTLYFPRVDAPIVERGTGPSRPLGQGGNETILVVEDEPAIRAVAVRVLTKLGYTVLEAESGQDGLARVLAHPGRVDLLITDMVMPGMTGPELAQALREREPRMRVLFTSGYSADAVSAKFGLTDEANFLAKPYALAELAREVRRLLDRPVG